MQKSFTDHLLAVKEKLGLTALDLAGYLGVTEKTISNYEKGKHLPPTSKQRELLKKIQELEIKGNISLTPGENTEMRFRQMEAGLRELQKENKDLLSRMQQENLLIQEQLKLSMESNKALIEILKKKG